MSAVTKRSGSYGRTLGVGAVLVLVLATLAVVNVYTNLAPEMSGSQQSMLLSGLVSILLIVAVALLFVATIIGRERTDDHRPGADRSRRDTRCAGAPD